MNSNSLKKEIASAEGREYIARSPHKIAIFMVFFISISLSVSALLLLTFKRTGTTVVSGKISSKTVKPSLEFELPLDVFPELRVGSELKIGFCTQNPILQRYIIATGPSTVEKTTLVRIPIEPNDLTETCSLNPQIQVIEPEQSLMRWLLHFIFPKKK